MNRPYVFLMFVMALMLPVLTMGQGSLSITVTTDKQDYGLGQIVTLTIQVQQSGAPVAHTSVYYELRDSQNQVRANGLITTDDTGRFTKQITIGNDFPLGAYAVYARVTVGDQTASATTAFQTIPEFSSNVVLMIAFVVGTGILGAFGRGTPFRKQSLYRET
jgi:hypothetical protein